MPALFASGCRDNSGRSDAMQMRPTDSGPGESRTALARPDGRSDRYGGNGPLAMPACDEAIGARGFPERMGRHREPLIGAPSDVDRGTEARIFACGNRVLDGGTAGATRWMRRTQRKSSRWL